MVAVHVRVPKEMKERLDELARQRRWTLAVTVKYAFERLIEQELQNHKKT